MVIFEARIPFNTSDYYFHQAPHHWDGTGEKTKHRMAPYRVSPTHNLRLFVIMTREEYRIYPTNINKTSTATTVGIRQHKRLHGCGANVRQCQCCYMNQPCCCALAALQSFLSPGSSHGQSSVSDAYITMCYLSLLFPLRSLTWLYFWLLYIVAANKGSVCLSFVSHFLFHLRQFRSALPAHERLFLILFVWLPVGFHQKLLEKRKGKKNILNLNMDQGRNFWNKVFFFFFLNCPQLCKYRTEKRKFTHCKSVNVVQMSWDSFFSLSLLNRWLQGWHSLRKKLLKCRADLQLGEWRCVGGGLEPVSFAFCPLLAVMWRRKLSNTK